MGGIIHGHSGNRNARGRLLHRRRRFPDRTLRLYRILPPPPEALLPRLPNPGSIRSPQTLSHLNQNGSKNPLRLTAANRGEAGGQGQLPSLTVPGPAHAVTRERQIPFCGNLRLRTLQEGNALESMSTAPAGVLSRSRNRTRKTLANATVLCCSTQHGLPKRILSQVLVSGPASRDGKSPYRPGGLPIRFSASVWV